MDLSFENVSLSFGDRKILNDISFRLSGNDKVVSVVGPSGAGKSTLIKLGTIALQYHRDAAVAARNSTPHLTGEITVQGDNIEEKVPHMHRRMVGHCLQKFDMLPGTIGNNILKPLKLLAPHLSLDQRRQAARQALLDVGLADVRLDQHTRELSGGQKQRVAIARAIALKPKLLFLDEPTSALDPISSRKILDLAKGLSDNTTVVVVTHDLDFARASDRIIVLAEREGQKGSGASVVCDGPTSDVFGAAMSSELSQMVHAFR